MVGDWEDFTVELVCEASLEVGRSLPVRKGVKGILGRQQICEGIYSQKSLYPQEEWET